MIKSSKYARIGKTQLAQIKAELEAWGRGERGAHLTWHKAEEIFGYSRDAMSNNADIKAALQAAQHSLKLLPKTREEAGAAFAELEEKVRNLERVNRELREQHDAWRACWQRIAYNLTQLGISMSRVDRPPLRELPDEQETAKILRPFDKKIPPSKTYKK